MEPFKFTRQTAFFLGILALLEVLVILFVPFIAIVFAVVAFALIVLVWLKAGLRTRKWVWWNPGNVPLTQAEGVIAVSAALLFSVGLLVAGHEGIRDASSERALPTSPVLERSKSDYPAEAPTPVLPDSRSAVTRSTYYADPGMQRAFKDELARAGIAFSTDMKQGKEFISWRPEDNKAVERIQRNVRPPASPSDRSVHFEKPHVQQAYKEWLVKRGVEYSVTTFNGREYVVWQDGPRELALQFLTEYQRPCPDVSATAGKKKSAPAKAAPANC